MPTRKLGRTQASATLRLEIFKRKGNHLELSITPPERVVLWTATRKDGWSCTSTVNENDISERRRNSAPYRRYPMSLLIAEAIHAACDWSDLHDEEDQP